MKPKTPILDSYEDYGCRVNAVSAAELFARYEEAGFLYPAKMQRLAPYPYKARDNWQRAMRGGELIHYVISYEEPETGNWGAISVWRSTHKGWNSQHLVSVGGPVASRAVMVSAQAVRVTDEFYASTQSWFQETNRFANKVFGSTAEKLGPQAAFLGRYCYLSVSLRCCQNAAPEIRVVPHKSGADGALYHLASQVRSEVYAQAEELGHDDLELDALDQLYSYVGLRRYRRVWLAYLSGHEAPVGAILAYRGPLGFNFSFLENRCDLLVLPTLKAEQKSAIARSLLQAAVGTYHDSPLPSLFIVADADVAPLLIAQGAEHIRDYSQSIWLQNGYEAWYRHVENFYDRIIKAGKRRGIGAALSRVPTSANPIEEQDL